MANYKLSPSDLVFLYSECPRCFYLKVRGTLCRPSMPMPKIFTAIDVAMKKHLAGKHSSAIINTMPAGLFEYAERWVESAPIVIPGRASTCFFRGRFDNVLRLDNGNYGLVDLKTAPRNAAHIPLYSRQLHAYTWSLENPAPNKLGLSPIESLGLLVFEPMDFANGTVSKGIVSGFLTWIEIVRNDGAFMAFLADIVDLLDSPAPPTAVTDCGWCRYRGLPY